MTFRTALTLLVLLTLAPRPGVAREESEPRLVNLNVIAVDSHGQPVNDLTRDDFQVTDAGKPQKIVFFQHKDRKLWEAPTLGPNEFSNRTSANVPYATVILFDMLNQRFGTRGVARSELEHFLEPLENADYLYLYILTLDGRLFAVHGLPEGREETREPGAPWTRQIKPMMEGALRTVTGLRPVDIDTAVRVPLTYQALTGLGVELTRVPGRKTIVWITDGVPIELGPIRSDTGDFVDFTPQLHQLSEALERSGVAIYPVRQIMLGSPNGVDGPTFGGGIASEATLDEFAGMTGGRPNGGRDIRSATKQAIEDVRSSYQIGYYPTPAKWDDKLHKVRVTSTRKGVRLQAKTGYYAWAEPVGSETQQAIDSLVPATFDAAEVGLRAAISQDPNSPNAAHFDLHIDAGDIELAREGDQYTGQLRVAVIEYLSDGGTRNSMIIPLDVHYTAEQRDQVLKGGIDFVQNVPLGENVKRVRFIVYDRESRTVGSVTIPIK